MADDKLTEYKVKQIKVKGKYQTASRELNSLKDDLIEFQRKTDNFKHKVEVLNKKIGRIYRLIERNEERIAKYSKSTSKIDKLKAVLLKGINIVLKAIRTTMRNLSKKYDKLVDDYEWAKNQAALFSKKVSETAQQIDTLKKMKQEVKDNYIKAKEQVKYQVSIGKAEAKRATEKAKEAAQKTIEQIPALYANYKYKIEDIDNKIEKLQKQLNDAYSRYKTIPERLRKTEKALQIDKEINELSTELAKLKELREKYRMELRKVGEEAAHLR